MGVEEQLAAEGISRFKGSKHGGKISQFVNDPRVANTRRDVMAAHRGIKKAGGVKRYLKTPEGQKMAVKAAGSAVKLGNEFLNKPTKKPKTKK